MIHQAKNLKTQKIYIEKPRTITILMWARNKPLSNILETIQHALVTTWQRVLLQSHVTLQLKRNPINLLTL